MSKITDKQKQAVITEYLNSATYRAISEKTKVARSTVGRIITTYKAGELKYELTPQKELGVLCKIATALGLSDCISTESKLNSQISALREQLDSRRFEDSDEYKKHSAIIASVENSDNCGAAAEINAKIVSLTESITEIMAQIAAHKAAEKAKSRIKELQEQHKILAEELAKYENGEYLCELFIRTKINMLDERINSKFKTLKVKLFHEQKNGGIAETCDMLIPCESGLVEYFQANTASRFNAGLEIISVLSEHFNLEMPVFADNSESVTEPLKIPQQTIYLTVSKADKALRLETI